MDADVCWSCRVAKAAGYARGSWSYLYGRVPKSGKSKKTRNTIKDQEDTPRNSGPQTKRAQDNVQGQRIILPGPTIKSPVIVSYPKITAGPSLVKRKLGSNHWDAVHERIQGQKRDGGQCPAVSFQSCPASLNGGCCPTDRICGSSSCLPNTLSASVVSACGKANYIACGIPEGGGCCPSDYICATDGCTPSPGVSVTSTCSAGFYLCPQSLNYGCCKNGLGCAINSCYSTAPVTFTVTETIKTTDSNSVVRTITTTITSETVVGAPTTTLLGGVVAKESAIPVTNTAIPKTLPTSSATSNNGLTKPELGGIIGGASVFLIVIILVAFVIIRKLNKTIKVTELANSRGTSSQRRSSRQTQSMQQDLDNMSVDPLMMTPSEVSSSVRRSSRQSALHTTTHELASPASPPVFYHPFQTNSPHAQYQQGYNPVASSDYQYSDSNGGYGRNQSFEGSDLNGQNPNGGYFDYAPQSNRRYSQVSSIPTRRPSQHNRNWSDASDFSAVSQGSDPAELSGDERRSSLQRNMNRLRRSFSRKKSEPQPTLQGGPARVDWIGTSNAGGGLGHIAEAGESRVTIDDSGGATNAGLREIPLQPEPVQYEKGIGNPEYDQKVMGRSIDLLGGRKSGEAS